MVGYKLTTVNQATASPVQENKAIWRNTGNGAKPIAA